KQSAMASSAGLGDVAVVADAVTSVLGAYGVKTISAKKATDILVAAVREGKAEPEDFARSIGKVTAVAKLMGVGFDEVAGAMAATSLQGINAHQSAQQLRALLVTFLKPTKGTRDELMAMHVSLATVRKEIRDKGLL